MKHTEAEGLFRKALKQIEESREIIEAETDKLGVIYVDLEDYFYTLDGASTDLSEAGMYLKNVLSEMSTKSKKEFKETLNKP